MSDPACRYSGGSAGSENRYHFAAVDCARWDDATTGADAPSPLHVSTPTRLAAAQTGTMASGRGKINGKMYDDERWRGGF